MASDTEFDALPSWSKACGPASANSVAAASPAPVRSAAGRHSAKPPLDVRRRRRSAQAGPPPTSAAGSLIAIAAPASAPDASALGALLPPRPVKIASAATIGAMARVSLCAPATRWKSRSGLQVHISAVRSRRSGVRDVRYRTAAVSANASVLISDITKTVSRTDSPPIRDASASCAVASGPYTEGARRHSSTAPTTGSPDRSAALVAYGSWPSTAIRPYAA
ncbi:hypothetical protein Acsp03_46980 [Actinomadura sp. NBRC 104412]|nr:hypothetical protein Acsp03_46980 [Actinomadura sp. NBRC 104412]